MDELIEIYKKTLIQLHVDSKSDEEIDKMAREIIESRPDKETLRKSIGFAYYSGMVSEEEIEKFKKQVEDQKINFFKRDKSKEVYNSLHDFANEVLLILGSNVTETILLGAAGSGLWAIVTDWVKFVRGKIKGKKLKKISGGKVKEETKTVFHLRLKLDEISEVDFELGKEISEIELDESLRKALIIAKEESEKDKIELLKAKKRYRYNHKAKKWEIMEIRKK